MPLRIAICDDVIVDLRDIAALVAQYAENRNLTIDTFTSVEQLLVNASQGIYDVVLLDIEMPEQNGYIVAREMQAWNNAPLVIFVTNSMEYTIRGYGVAFRYLPKPLNYTMVCEALDAAAENIFSERYTFSYNGSDYVVNIKDIYYFEVYNHWTTIHFSDEVFRVRASLKSIRAELPQNLFGAPHNSYLVNFAHIKSASSTEIRLANGEVIPISRRNYNMFTSQFGSFLRKK